MNLKQKLGAEIALKAKTGDCIGFGTGTTAEEAIRAIGERVKSEGLVISGVSTSIFSTNLAMSYGIKIMPISAGVVLDWGFDGADEIGKDRAMLKGKGGAHLKEKIIANALPEWIVVVVEDKLVNVLGGNCALPVEVIPMAMSQVEVELMKLGAAKVVVRTGTNFYGPLFTENGNVILDAKFSEVNEGLVKQVKAITGVVEHGYFQAKDSTKILVAKNSGEVYWL